MRIRKPWSLMAVCVCGSFAAACGDDDSIDIDWNYDASVNDAGLDAGGDPSTSTDVDIITLTDDDDSTSIGLPTGSTETSLDAGMTSDVDMADASTGATGTDDSSGYDASTGETETSSPDGGTVETDETASDDTAIDAGPDGSVLDAAVQDADTESSADVPDAQVFIPDGGVVLRPTELPFEEARLADLQVPAGFGVQVFATPGGTTRMLAANGGGIYVTRPEQGDVLRLEDNNADGVAEVSLTAVSGYPMVHGIAFNGDSVYLATPTTLLRGSVNEDGTFGLFETLIDDLPDGGQHWARTLGVGPDNQLYLSIGSSCDACAEANPEHATLLQVALDGTTRTVFASGLRNTIGFDWHPVTAELWGMDNGSDWRGDDIPPEELNQIEQGNNYGWPYCYGDRVVDPVIGDPANMTKAEYCAATTPSVLNNQAHEAPIGFVFYDAQAFPAEYQGDAFVAMHGSWNRIPATGYKIVRISFENGAPTAIEDFVSGFLNESGTATFGRPAGVTVDAQGALLFSDDSNGVLYRVTAD